MVPTGPTTSTHTLAETAGSTTASPMLWGSFLTFMVLLGLANIFILNRKGASDRWQIHLLKVCFFFVIAGAVALAILTLTSLGATGASQFGASYISEWFLSIDGLFIMKVIIDRTGVPAAHERKILMAGIWLNIVLRCVVITAGATMLQYFSFVGVLLGILLIYTAIATFRDKGEDFDLEQNKAYQFLTQRMRLPIDNAWHNGHLTVKVDGKRKLTKSGLVVLSIGVICLGFAVDSIPVVLAITDNLFIAVASNAMAVMGLQSVYPLFHVVEKRVSRLSQGLAIILFGIGTEQIITNPTMDWLHAIFGWLTEHVIRRYEFPMWAIFAFIVVVLVGTYVASHFRPLIRVEDEKPTSAEQKEVAASTAE